jgi:hypothetical protein
LDVSLKLNLGPPQGIRDIFQMRVVAKHDGYVIAPSAGICHGSLTAADLKHHFYGAYGECIEDLFRQRVLERLEAD